MSIKNDNLRRGDRVAEGARLESVCAVWNSTKGSNPFLSATKKYCISKIIFNTLQNKDFVINQK